MAQSPTTFFRVDYLPEGSFYKIPPTSSRRSSSPSGTFSPPAKRMGMSALSFLDVIQGIKEKTWARTLPGRPRERGQTPLGMIAHHHHPLMVRMKSTWRMKLVLVWGH